MKKVLFLCVHNSCRSQIAEALAKKYGGSVLRAYSAGTHLKGQINQDAVRLMKDRYGIDMEATQRPKLVEEVPQVDQVITMGCHVTCPVLPYDYDVIDWGLDDPTGQPDEIFIETIEEVEKKIKELVRVNQQV